MVVDLLFVPLVGFDLFSPEVLILLDFSTFFYLLVFILLVLPPLYSATSPSREPLCPIIKDPAQQLSALQIQFRWTNYCVFPFYDIYPNHYTF
jgi:hypothetical protein